MPRPPKTERWQPAAVLVFSDSRTLKRLLARGGLSDREPRVPTTVEFLDRQQWIPASHPGLMVLRRWWLLATLDAAAPSVPENA